MNDNYHMENIKQILIDLENHNMFVVVDKKFIKNFVIDNRIIGYRNDGLGSRLLTYVNIVRLSKKLDYMYEPEGTGVNIKGQTGPGPKYEVDKDGNIKMSPPFIGYNVEATDEVFPVAEVKIREDGRGYGGQFKFEMVLHKDFAPRLENAQKEIYG